jgi:predicted TIM-barrel fold metal-dependent hydrolase
MRRDELRGHVFDADNHFYETRDALTKFVPAAYKDAIRFVDIDGRTKVATRGQISDYIPNPTFDKVAAPGAQEDFYRRGNSEGKSYREVLGPAIDCLPAFREPKSRLELMDEQGIARTLMFPTLASLVEERFRDDPDAIHAIIHAVNEWMFETWSFNYEDRILSTPIITLPIVEQALDELDWVLERGAQVILIRPAPVPGFRGPRSFGLPEFDPFWERVESEQIPVCMHVSDSGYARQSGEWDGPSEFKPFQPSPFRAYWSHAHPPMADALAAMVCHGALSRFPRLRIASMENGSQWLAPVLAGLADAYRKMPQGFHEDPIETIRRSFYLSPFWEDDMRALSKLLPLDHLLFGSDYPHPEGLAEPLSYVDSLTGFSDTEVRMLMGDNLTALVG